MRLRQVGQLIGLQTKLLNLKAGLEDMRDLGIEHESQVILLEGQFDVMMEGPMDDQIEADAEQFNSFITILNVNREKLHAYLIVSGGEMNLVGLVPLSIGRLLPESDTFYGRTTRLHYPGLARKLPCFL